MIRRRSFISLLGGAAAWPLAAWAQAGRMRSVGILNTLAADDANATARVAAFVKMLRELGWTEGHNLRIETRWAAGDADLRRRSAAELLALAPDVIFAGGSGATGTLLQA